MNEILTRSAVEQARLIREREISPDELRQAHIRSIEEVNPLINAVTQILDPRPAADGPFHGVPFSIKDSIEVARTVTTAGTLGRRGAAPSTQDAELVARLCRAGAVPLAKTNLPDLLFSFETDNLIFGRTSNPYDLTRTSGGSSGGEAALIAACGSPMGLGSDAAGSVRLPAAFCGIASIKPTSRRLPRQGHFPPAGGWIEALWQIGPMARRVQDLVAMMPVLLGQPFEAAPTHDLRVAFYTDNGIAAADPDVARVVRAAADVMKAEEARPACLEASYDLEMKLIGPDGGDSLREYLEYLGSNEIHPLLRGWLDKLEAYRTDLRGFQKYWAEWDAYRAEMCAFLERFDVIVCPAYPQPALAHGTSIEEANFSGFSHTMAYNVAGWPAAVVRCGESATGLPIAVQVAAGPGREDQALAVALRLEEAFGGWRPSGALPV